MAKKPAAAPAAFEPEGFYDLTVSRVAAFGRVTFRPGQTYQVKGKVALSLGDAVETALAIPVDPGVAG